MGNNKLKRKVMNFTKSLLFIIILGLLGFLLGSIIGKNNSFLADSILVILSIIITIGLLIYIYLKVNIFNSLISSNTKKKLKKYLYFTIAFLAFVMYYLYNKDTFFRTYEMNSFGINQNQYIFIANFIGFFSISFIIYNLIFKEYSLKKLSKNEIELSEELDIADKQSNLINKYEEIIKKYSQIICKIDKTMNDLDNEGFIRDDYEIDEYIIIIEEFIKELTLVIDDISIIVKSSDSFESFAKEELGCNSFNIKKIKTNIEANRVYVHSNKIYIMYGSSIINNSIVLIIHMDNAYPGELGLLVYSYLFTLETSYSKYLIDVM